ncbi:MAG: ABC transporter ATP-binding protein [Lachnospiraceae bacterium]|nr:ABC transporter ATP-binding protein [Lachnospiraceae bacterium]
MAVNSYKTDEQLKEKGKYQTLGRLFAYMLPYKKEIIAVLLMMGYGVVISLINPKIMQRAIDVNIAGHDMHGLVKMLSIALVINLLLVVTIKIRMYIMAGVCNKVLLTIRQELYTHIQKLDFGFFDSRPTGKILSRIIGDINSLKDVLSNSVTSLIPDSLTIIAVVVIMFCQNAKLAAAALITTPIMGIATSLVEIKARPKWQVFRKKSANLNAFVHEDLSGIRVIQSFGAEDETRKTFAQLLKEHRASFIDAVRISDSFGSIIDISWGIGCICMYYIGIVVLKADHVTVGTFTAFSVYLNMFWQPINNITNFYNQLVTNIAGAERVFEIMDTPPAVEDKISAESATGSDAKKTDKAPVSTDEALAAGIMPEVKGQVTFENVSFAYEKDTQVLDNVSFEVKPGETIALVGPTGAGKSTIVNLISRFYDVTGGKVLIDGTNVKDVTIESLRSQMGVMTQDSFLFTGTIRENIRYGRLDASDADVEEAAKTVHADEFIRNMEKGYDTEVSNGSGALSVGQIQLIALARTMLSQPKILILDEATSSIDTRTELLVQDGISRILKGRTSFVIAHRLSTIQKADRIFVVDDGHIVEEGSADELMAKRGIYYDLCMAQAM